jgi:hypothetical protein
MQNVTNMTPVSAQKSYSYMELNILNILIGGFYLFFRIA